MDRDKVPWIIVTSHYQIYLSSVSEEEEAASARYYNSMNGEFSPQALSDDLIFSYYVAGCMEGCMRAYIIRYFPLTPGTASTSTTPDTRTSTA